MKRIVKMAMALTMALAFALGGCAVGVEQRMEGPAQKPPLPAGGFTATPAPSRIARLVTVTPAVRQVPGETVTVAPRNNPVLAPTNPSAPPRGMALPVDESGFQEITLDGFPFTFQLPFGWAPVLDTQEGWAWTPAGEAAPSGEAVFSLKIVRREAGQELTALLPAGGVMEGRAEVIALGATVPLYRMTVMSGGAARAHQAHVFLQDGAGGRVYLFSVSASTPEEREALEGILLHALDSLTEKKE